ncbi:MAG: alpha/beta fold hydrolase, partial [Deltaproteobacteria bacterium]|nr:alpha/beta fold hydrolase [Deltaproteobacteria bacterium]
MAETYVNGVRLNYRLDGPEGAPVVLLSNSLAASLSMWEGQLPALVGAGFRVLRYDTRGHGASEVVPGPYSMEMLTADALALLDGLNLERVHFCGLSMGGMVGQMLGTHHGERLHSLILCDTAAYTGPPEVWNRRIKAVSEGGMEAVVNETIERWFTPPGLKRLPREVRDIRAGILATPVEGYCACGSAIRDMDQRQSIRAITTPTLVVVGEQDPGTTVEWPA